MGRQPQRDGARAADGGRDGLRRGRVHLHRRRRAQLYRRPFRKLGRGVALEPQRWEHGLLFLSFTVLFLTGVVQKYRNEQWSQDILSTPDRLVLVASNSFVWGRSVRARYSWDRSAWERSVTEF